MNPPGFGRLQAFRADGVWRAVFAIASLVQTARSLFRMQLDKMMTPFRKTNAEFYTGYFAARAIVDRAATQSTPKKCSPLKANIRLILVRPMTITEYIAHHQMQPVDMESLVRPGFVPPSLAHKFTLDDEVEYFVNPAKTRWVGICRKRKFFAASKPEAITTGKLDKPYPTLRSF